MQSERAEYTGMHAKKFGGVLQQHSRRSIEYYPNTDGTKIKTQVRERPGHTWEYCQLRQQGSCNSPL